MVLPINLLGDAAAAATLVQRATKNERKGEVNNVFPVILRRIENSNINPVSEVSEEQGVETKTSESEREMRNAEYRRELRHFRPPLVYQNTDQMVRIKTPYPMPERLGRLFDEEA